MPTGPSLGHTRKRKPLNKTRNTRNLKRTVSALMVSIGLTLVTTAARALAGGTWAGAPARNLAGERRDPRLADFRSL